MTAAARPTSPSVIPTPRHGAPADEHSRPADGPRHRAAADDAAQQRIADPAERSRAGRHAAPDDAGPAGEDPLAWLGFRFEQA